MPLKTEVCVTVDVEHSIAGAFAAPERYLPLGDEVVQCVVNGREQGLGFILDALAEGGIAGTFFVEALQVAYFGDAPMARTAKRIADAGHDVQLHLHPCWLHFRDEKWRQLGFVPNDACSGRTDAELDEMMSLGIAAFERWGIAQPIALRTGGFQTDHGVFRAMARAGLTTSSNIGLGVTTPAASDLHLFGGRHWIDGVLELPALSYRTPEIRNFGRDTWRTLSITATSQAEIEKLLWSARENDVRSIVVLTHPHEFVTRKSMRFDDLGINHVNQSRLTMLAKFLNQNSADFEVVTFGGKSSDWLQTPNVIDAPLRTSMRLTASRMGQNVLNDLGWLR